MRTKITPFAFMLLALLFTSTLANAQKPKLMERWEAIKKNKTAQTQKVASHADLPEYVLEYYWNGSAWDTSGQLNNTYSINGYLIEQLRDFYSSGVFAPSSKSLHTYNANGNETEMIYQSHNGTTWENSYRTVATFDNHQNQTSYISYNWVNSAWEISFASRSTYQYNSSNQITEEVVEDYDTGTSSYVLSEKTIYTYSAGLPSEFEYLEWDGTNWVPSFKVKNVVWYDFSRDLVLSMLYQEHDGTAYVDLERGNWTYGQNDSYVGIYQEYAAGTWTNSYRDVVDYDAYEHETLIESSFWSNSMWELNYGDRAIYLYNGQGNTVEVSHEQFYFGTSGYENTNKYVYSSFFVGAADAIQNELGLTVFPNPASSKLNFDLKMEKNGPVVIELFDLQGRKRLVSSSSFHGQTISLSLSESLENGTYFYRVSDGNALSQGKIAIQR